MLENPLSADWQMIRPQDASVCDTKSCVSLSAGRHSVRKVGVTGGVQPEEEKAGRAEALPWQLPLPGLAREVSSAF